MHFRCQWYSLTEALSDVRATSPGSRQLDEQLHYTYRLIEECFPGWGKGWSSCLGSNLNHLPLPLTQPGSAHIMHRSRKPPPGSSPWPSLAGQWCAHVDGWNAPSLAPSRQGCVLIKMMIIHAHKWACPPPLHAGTAHSEGLTSIKRSDKCVIITSQLIRLEPNTRRARCIFLPDSTRWC